MSAMVSRLTKERLLPVREELGDAPVKELAKAVESSFRNRITSSNAPVEDDDWKELRSSKPHRREETILPSDPHDLKELAFKTAIKLMHAYD
jgi:hypothetical protein